MRRKRKSKARRGQKVRPQEMLDTVTGWVTQSSTTTIARSTLEVPTDRSFVVMRLSVEFITEASSKVVNTGVVQIRLYQFNAVSAVWTSGPFLVGLTPVKKTFNFTNQLWWPVKTAAATTIIAIDGLCQGADDNYRVRFVARVMTHVTQEVVAENCPKVLRPGALAVTPLCKEEAGGGAHDSEFEVVTRLG